MFVVKWIADEHRLYHKSLRLIKFFVAEFVELVRRQLNAVQKLQTLRTLCRNWRVHHEVSEV